MKLEFLDNFKDPYLATTEGRGVFLSGVVLGMLAQAQTPPGGTVDAAPISSLTLAGCGGAISVHICPG